MKPKCPNAIVAAAVLLLLDALSLLFGTVGLIIWGELHDQKFLDDRGIWMAIGSCLLYLLPVVLPWQILLACKVLEGDYRRIKWRAIYLLVVAGVLTVMLIVLFVLKLKDQDLTLANFLSLPLWNYAASIWLILNLVLVFLAGYLLLRNASQYEIWRIAYRDWKSQPR